MRATSKKKDYLKKKDNLKNEKEDPKLLTNSKNILV